jgi:hypothetical protein
VSFSGEFPQNQQLGRSLVFYLQVIRCALSIFRIGSKVGSFKHGARGSKEDEMKRAATMIVAVAALMLMAMVPAYAQQTSAKVNIPFTFTVDDVRMPAGEYLITSPSEKVISIQRVGGTEAKVTLTTSGSAARNTGPAKLVFHRYGNAYFVAAAWMPMSDHSQEFFASASEIEVARTGGQDVIELALLVAK